MAEVLEIKNSTGTINNQNENFSEVLSLCYFFFAIAVY